MNKNERELTPDELRLWSCLLGAVDLLKKLHDPMHNNMLRDARQDLIKAITNFKKWSGLHEN